MRRHDPTHPSDVTDHSERQLLEDIHQQGEQIMADLTNVIAALAKLDTDVTQEAADVTTEITALQAEIGNLTAGGLVTQDQIDSLTAHAVAIDTAVQAVDTAAKAATPAP